MALELFSRGRRTSSPSPTPTPDPEETPKHSVLLREAEDDDLDEIETIVNNTLPRDLWVNQYELVEMLARKHNCYVVEFDGVMAGFVLVKGPSKSGILVLSLIGVLEDYRRKSLAFLLLKEAIEDAPVVIRRVIARVPDDLLPMHLFLKATGFTCVKVDGDIYHFVLELDDE